VKILPAAVALLVLAGVLLGLRFLSAPRAAQREGGLPRVLAPGFPLRVENGAGGVLELPAPPRRVLAANAAWVDYLSLLVEPERLCALPAEAFGYSRLALVDDPRWRALPQLPGFEAERVLALAPDLVLAHSWQSAETLDTLRRAGIPTLVVPVPESWQEITDTLALLATLLDVPERGRALAIEFEQRRSALRARAAPYAGWRALCYTNLGQGGWTAGARTTFDVLLGLAGLANAAAEAGMVGDAPADRERLIAIDPELFVVGRPDRSESSPPSAEFLLGEPALAGLRALRERRIVSLPPALFTTASPELLTGAEALVDALAELASAGAARDSRPGGG